ncbi:MAG: Hsp33 family molecular chaperone HslO [Gammaproteobacteria bacterium]|nr:Hsp33 family molecular chaperone HslO [Gammaproteobacteria bacterium]
MSDDSQLHQHDNLQRFVFEGAPIRGEIVRLDATYRAVLDRRDYPPAIREILGEMMAATALLASTLKFEGRLIMQIQGDGPITLAMAECSESGVMRAIAQWQGDVTPAPLEQLVGRGQFAITIDPDGSRERYQGIVTLQGGSVAAALEHYFAQSEQLDTRLWLVTDSTQAAGMLLQKLPDTPFEDADAWDRAVHLGATLTREELLLLPVPDLLHRLYHEEDVRLFARQPLSFRCSCSRDRVEGVLRMMGQTEVESILQERGNVQAECEFCGAKYEFDPIDAAQLFTDPAPADTPSTRQ